MATRSDYYADNDDAAEIAFNSFPGATRKMAAYAADTLDRWLPVIAGVGATLATLETGPLSLVAGGAAYKGTKILSHSVREKIYRNFVNDEGGQ